MKNLQILLLLFFSFLALAWCGNKSEIFGQTPEFLESGETEIIGQSLMDKKNNREVYIYTKEEIKDYLKAKKAIYDEQAQNQIYLGRKCIKLQKKIPPPKQKAKYIRAKNAAAECERKYYANSVEMNRIDDKDLPAPLFKTKIDETGFFSVKVPAKKIYVLISPPTSIVWLNADSEIEKIVITDEIDLGGKNIEQ